MKNISIIIPTRNRTEILEKNLKHLSENNRSDYEVIIVDDGSELKQKEKIESLKRKYKSIKVINIKNKGPAMARNCGIEKAEGKIIIFINDDSIVNKNFIEKHEEFHNQNTEDNVALVGPFVTHPDLIKTPIMKWLVNESKMHFYYRKLNENELPWYYFWTCNISIKSIFLKINKLKFNTSFPTAAWEDVEFGYRANIAGLKLYYDKKLVVYHYHDFGLKEILDRFFSHGRGMYHLVDKIPYKYLPLIARKPYRLIIKVLLTLTIYKITKRVMLKSINFEKKTNNLLLQYLILGEKIEGWNFEEARMAK